MVNEDKDPLDDLFVDGDETNRALLRDILIGYLRIDENGRIFPLSAFFALPNKNKIILFLLARKAVSMKTGSEEAVSPSDAAGKLDMPEGSLRPTLRLLVQEGLADDSNGRYKIFNHAVARCSQTLKKKEDSAKGLQTAAAQGGGTSKASMFSVLKSLVEEGRLDEGRTAREIHTLVEQRRPGTTYGPLYKIILDALNKNLLVRELKGGNWAYRRAAPK